LRLSVVTPSFQSAHFIGETLDSVAALRAPHEHLVMDGGSTDGTVERLRARDDASLVWVSDPTAARRTPSTRAWSVRAGTWARG
jgi:GT2 family glycosyltransferase